jgi:hypothetical protein
MKIYILKQEISQNIFTSERANPEWLSNTKTTRLCQGISYPQYSHKTRSFSNNYTNGEKKYRDIIVHEHLENIFRKGDYCWGRRVDSLTISGKFKPRPYKLHVEWKKCHH